MLPPAAAIWTSRFILDLLTGVGGIVAVSFSLTMIAIGGYYLLRVAQGAFGGLSGSAVRERAKGADQARRLALMTLICGPLFTTIPLLIVLPMLMIERGFRFGLLNYLGVILVVMALGLVTGLIGGGAFYVTARLLGPVRKQIRKWRRGKAWDPDFDGIA